MEGRSYQNPTQHTDVNYGTGFKPSGMDDHTRTAALQEGQARCVIDGVITSRYCGQCRDWICVKHQFVRPGYMEVIDYTCCHIMETHRLVPTSSADCFCLKCSQIPPFDTSGYPYQTCNKIRAIIIAVVVVIILIVAITSATRNKG